VFTQIAELERERDAVVETEAPDKASKMIQQLTGLRGIGVQSATVLVREAFCTSLRQWQGTRIIRRSGLLAIQQRRDRP
jgi:hypothetical protein